MKISSQNNKYFKTEKDFKTFVQYWNSNMVPLIASWWSNINGIGIRWRIIKQVHIKNKCWEAKRLYYELTSDKVNLDQATMKIEIRTIEQLRFLDAISWEIEETYLEVWLKIYLNRKKLGVILI